MNSVSINERGFGLIEALIAVVVTVIMALAMASMLSGQAKQNAVLASQNSNMALAAAIRTQLARKASCFPSLISPPGDYSAGGEIAVRLGPNDATQIVRAGAELTGWKTKVTSFRAENLTQFGTTNSGNAVFIGDIVLRSVTTDLGNAARVQLKEFVAARITFEVNGATLISCYAGDPYSDTSQQLEQICSMSTSADGEPAVWQNGHCILPTGSPEKECQKLGGTWVNSYCQPKIEIVGKVIPAFSPHPADNAGGKAPCPQGKKVVGGTCLSSTGKVPLNTIIDTNTQTFLCGWPDTPEYNSNEFVMQAQCI